MKFTSIICLVFLLMPFKGVCQRNIGKQIEKQRREEFAQSHQKRTLDSIFLRENLTLTEFNERLELEIEHPDSSYFITMPRKERNDPEKWYFYYQVRRNLDFSVKQLVRGVIIKGFWFDFHLLIRNDTILGVKVLEGGRNLYERMFEAKYRSLQHEHERFYNVKLKNYGDEHSPFNFYYYGTFVGLHQGILRHCELMARYYQNGNKRKLVKWLKSMNPELQAYAVQGLYYLRKHKGVEITEEEERIIEHIKNRQSTVHVNPMVPTKKILNENYFDEAFASLKERGHIKE